MKIIAISIFAVMCVVSHTQAAEIDQSKNQQSSTSTEQADKNQLNIALNTYDAGKFSVALKILQPLVTKGNSTAKRYVATIYMLGGDGINKDMTKAVDLFSSAVNDGDHLSMHMLGELYRQGLGVKKDEK